MGFRQLTSIIGLSFATSFTAFAEVPDYYPDNYKDLIEASKNEKGLVIYSNMADNNWQPVIESFNKSYPWIKIETLDLGSGTVHSRWEAEAGSNSRTADILVSGANDRWTRYGLNGEMLAYESPEKEHLPEFAKPYEGVYVVSTDPLVITYNTALLPEGKRPTGVSSLVKMATDEPKKFKGKITTYDAARNSFGLAAWWTTLNAKGDKGWEELRAIGPMIRGETSGGPMNEKIASGEYLAGIAVSGITIFPRLEQPGGKILGFTFPDDGTPVMLRGLGIAKNTNNPNSAKLFLDYLLSNEGQTLIGKGGLTPYRDDVDESEVRYTYQGIAEIVGADNMIIVGFDKALIDEASSFVEKWNAALNAK
ncbi:2-aminoethylphosphonate ABC transporter substrate-binding protein [Oligella ureolytica]|uniref:ABC transporter substrate-binding protein n=1 Tax=Oligella ureolytica TaxID=90244 RepID=UPI000E012920|nr:extracellular solute-binding protein [Oligella ureolytica]SUA59101.1 2-aminoethylphosphonate ABC transporter substrate-binding protein [Oligella ureolytica]